MEINISQLRGYHKNPRKITKDQFSDLKKSLEELGDLSGIIINKPTMELIGGNMRDKVMNLKSSNITWVIEHDTPTKTGTLALGYVVYNAEKYSVRLVEWTEEQCELANIRANKMGGSFDFDMLANEFDMDILLNSGFSREELEGFDLDDDLGEGEGSGEGDGDFPEGEGRPTIALIFLSQDDAEDAYDEIKQFAKERFDGVQVSFSSN